MAGGAGNPLGARAIYLGNTIYRIHGTNMPATIGQKVSSGCIRMLNADVIDLYSRVTVGTKIVVLPIRPALPGKLPRRPPWRHAWLLPRHTVSARPAFTRRILGGMA